MQRQAIRGTPGDGSKGDENPIDMDLWVELREAEIDGGERFLEEVIDLFLAELETNLCSIRAAVDSGNLDCAAAVAHSISGGAGNLGAFRLTAICGRLEKAAAGESIESVEALFRFLESEALRVRHALLREKGWGPTD